MKIVQINSVCGVGSTGRIATDLNAYIREQGDDCLIAYGRGEGKNCDAIIRVGNARDTLCHVARTRLLDRHGFGSRRATQRFIEQIQAYDPDLFHLHNVHGYYLHIPTLFSYLRQAGKPIVWTLHDCWSFTGHCAYYDYAHCEKWKFGCNACPQKKAYPKSFLLDASKKNYEEKQKIFTGLKDLVLVTPSDWLRNQVQQSFLKEYPVQVIPNGVDLSVFCPAQTASSVRQQYGIGENAFLLIGVANIWEERKGLRYLIELSERLGEGYRTLVVGVDERQKRMLGSHMIGIERTSSAEELAALYSAADVFINPTLEDNFPTTNLEAFACGTPVITFATGGSPESVDADTGIVVEQGNVSQLAEAVYAIRKKSKEAYTDACRQKAQKLYSVQNACSNYYQLYEDLGSR